MKGWKNYVSHRTHFYYDEFKYSIAMLTKLNVFTSGNKLRIENNLFCSPKPKSGISLTFFEFHIVIFV